MPPRRVIGVDAGGTKLLGGVVDEELRVHHRVQRVWGRADRASVVDTMVEAVEEARAAAPAAEAVGIGVPSLVDYERGVSLTAVHLPLEDVPIRDLLAERLGVSVHVDNDANAAVLAEQRAGAAKGASHVVMLTVGTGIGGGLVLGGRLYRGSVGAAAELGHMVVDLDGPDCDCPGRWCLETVASGTALGAEGRDAARRDPGSALGRALAGGREITGALVTELAHDGDETARDAVALVGRRLGAGIASLVNAFNPEVVVIGGGVVAAGDLLIEPARAVVAERALGPSRDRARILPSHFGPEAGLVGAAILALENGAV